MLEFMGICLKSNEVQTSHYSHHTATRTQSQDITKTITKHEDNHKTRTQSQNLIRFFWINEFLCLLKIRTTTRIKRRIELNGKNVGRNEGQRNRIEQRTVPTTILFKLYNFVLSFRYTWAFKVGCKAFIIWLLLLINL